MSCAGDMISSDGDKIAFDDDMTSLDSVDKLIATVVVVK